jgi:hypothetical protein
MMDEPPEMDLMLPFFWRRERRALFFVTESATLRDRFSIAAAMSSVPLTAP